MIRIFSKYYIHFTSFNMIYPFKWSVSKHSNNVQLAKKYKTKSINENQKMSENTKKRSNKSSVLYDCWVGGI